MINDTVSELLYPVLEREGRGILLGVVGLPRCSIALEGINFLFPAEHLQALEQLIRLYLVDEAGSKLAPSFEKRIKAVRKAYGIAYTGGRFGGEYVTSPKSSAILFIFGN